MADLFAYASFPGVLQLDSCTYTLSHGVTPGVITLTIAPQDSHPKGFGDLVLTFGSVKITIKDCEVDSASFQFNQSGQLVSLLLKDRRWKWQFGSISGNYNLREDDGRLVKKQQANQRGAGDAIDDTERTPRELAKLCLEAAGETGFDLGDLPNDARPTVEWDGENPMKALADLCEDLGCRVVMQSNKNNTVKICRAGKGAPLPQGYVIDLNAALDPPTEPDAITVRCGHSRYQVDLLLEAIGTDLDDATKVIDDLTYKPAAGWGKLDLPNCYAVSDPKARELAKRTVFRTYRIAIPAGGIDIPGYAEKITNLKQILPIEDEQVETFTEDGIKKNKPAVVYGKWWKGGLGGLENTTETVVPLRDSDEQFVGRDFTIDTQRGIVRFSEPIFALEGAVTNKSRIPAVLRLRVAVGIRDAKTRAFVRHEKTRKKPGKKRGTKAQYIRRDEIIRSYTPTYGGSFNRPRVTDNLKDVDKECDYYIDAEIKSVQIEDPQVGTYGGIMAVNPDGALQSITWSLGIAGPTTRISRNQDLGTPSTIPYKLRRINERNRGTATLKDALKPHSLAKLTAKATVK